MIRATGEIRIPFDAMSEGALERLRRAATVPIRSRERRFGELRWIETSRDLSRIDRGDLVLPRGMLAEARAELGDAEWSAETTRAEYRYEPRIAWRRHQVDAAEIAAAKVQGLVLAATGAGKTGLALALLAKIAQRGVVMAPTVALAEQWEAEIARFLGVAAAVCTGGTWTDAPIVVTTPATAMRHVDRLRGYGALVIDECQGFATEIRTELIGRIPARWRIGLTGTLPRDHRGQILRRVIGPVIYRYSVADGLDAGVLVSPTYEQVETDFRFEYGGAEDWARLLEALVADEKRNRQIVDLVLSECAGITALVLSARLAHLDVLATMLADRGARVAILSGQTPPEDRARILASARAGELDVVLGSTVADVGLDLPALGALVLAFPSRGEPRLLQRIGRVVRAAPGKERPRIFDLVDRAGPLERQAELRRQTFERAFAGARRVAA